MNMHINYMNRRKETVEDVRTIKIIGSSMEVYRGNDVDEERAIYIDLTRVHDVSIKR